MTAAVLLSRLKAEVLSKKPEVQSGSFMLAAAGSTTFLRTVERSITIVYRGEEEGLIVNVGPPERRSVTAVWRPVPDNPWTGLIQSGDEKITVAEAAERICRLLS